MKSVKAFLFVLLLMLASWAWSAEIHDAALNGDLAKVKELLAKNPALLTAGNDLGRTPLHLAAHRGHVKLAAWLIQQGADVNGRDSSYQLAPLHLAAWGGDLETVRLLLKKGADLQAREKDNENALYYAALSPNLELVKFLVAKGLKVRDTESSAGNTPLSIALQRGNLAIAEYFLAAGADALCKDREGSTTLHMACMRGKQALIELLLRKGVAIDARDNAGWTPLLLATIFGNREAVKVLLAHGADSNTRNQNGLFPLLQAAKDGAREIALLLLAAGARAGDSMGDTGIGALHMACALGYGDIVKALLDKGADANAKSKWGHSPHGLAYRYGHKNIAELLLSRGATAEKSLPEPAGPEWLKKQLSEGEALVWYTDHSGWAVKTAKHLLVFDYFKPGPAPDQAGLANGTLVPAELKEQAMTVFISHGHNDHYTPALFDWKKEIKNITYITGFKLEGKEGYQILSAHEKHAMNGMEIIPIESNDSGQGYFIKVDGVSIFHPGDHANRQRDFSGPFKKEIDFLADQSLKADILFAPVSGCGFGDIVAVKKGDYYTMDRLAARHVFPMHAAGNPLQYQLFAKEAKGRGYENAFHCAEFPGDCFAVKPIGR
ncbi:MAG TPA: ankyrin repeat domain-containing protein [Patescibacteria group bacterium]|nr:ankyrin repeat domain-containing protein [Patescibacteria group bacterium]